MVENNWFSDSNNDRARLQSIIQNVLLIVAQLKNATDRRKRIELLERMKKELEEFDKIFNEFYEAAKNLKLAAEKTVSLQRVLLEARELIEELKAIIGRVTSPPLPYGTFHSVNSDGTVNVTTYGGGKVKVNLHPSIKPETLKAGQGVILNAFQNVIEPAPYERKGEVVVVKDVLDEERVLVMIRADEERVAVLAEPLRGAKLKVGDHLLLDDRSGFILERMPKSEVEDLTLEEVPDISYEDIGGLAPQIEEIRDAVELPYLYIDYFKEHKLTPPKGVLLYGPPGCGKTLIAKAVANNLAEQISKKRGEKIKGYFLNIKGPELLNKYVGETERKIREIFIKAKEKAAEDVPVIIFFDEMDALFRTRGSGISSDVETSIVPQLLVELDGIEGLRNVIVIGASNRQDLVDPAILRPGRMDVKIKIERPDELGTFDILTKYAKPGIPIHRKFLRFDKPYITPNRIKELLPEEWAAMDKRLAPIRESLGLKRADLGKLETAINPNGFRRTLERLKRSDPRMAETAETVFNSQRKHWEHESWEMKSEKDCWHYFCYKTTERVFIKMPDTDKMPHTEMLMWISTEGELVVLDTRFIEVTYANGDKEMLYHKDFASGAMLESIVRRAKTYAVKRKIATGELGLKMIDFWLAVADEFKENEDLPNTTNPDDWAKISGRKGERIVYVKPVSGGPIGSPFGRGVERVTTGLYL